MSVLRWHPHYDEQVVYVGGYNMRASANGWRVECFMGTYEMHGRDKQPGELAGLGLHRSTGCPCGDIEAHKTAAEAWLQKAMRGNGDVANLAKLAGAEIVDEHGDSYLPPHSRQ